MLPVPPLPFDAVLLAAGRSVRMGRDKALLDAGGAPLWRRQRAVLSAAGAERIFLSAREEQPWVREAAPEFAAVVTDEVVDAGPLAGIVAALARMQAPYLAVLAIDLPAMEARWFRELAERGAPGVGAVGKRGEFFEPLAAIYPRELLPSARAVLGRGESSLQRLIAAAVADGLMRVVEIEPDDATLFRNWNEPTSRADEAGNTPAGFSGKSEAPKGRHSIARGNAPGKSQAQNMSPEGA